MSIKEPTLLALAFFIAGDLGCQSDSSPSGATDGSSSGRDPDGGDSGDGGDASDSAGSDDSGPGETGDSDTADPPPDLPGACPVATFACSDDGFAQIACGWDPDLGLADWGWRIPCADGESCVDGHCAGSRCRSPEILFVVDRSDSMLEGGRWTWVAQALTEFGGQIGSQVVQGVRMFPEEPCSPGAVAPIESRPGGFGPLLSPPTTGASTPIHAALDDVAPAFGDPDQAQAVILITDGDETCEPDSSPALAASNLFRLGIRVYAVGVSTQANLPLLDEIAALGGTVAARRADDGATLRTVLDAIVEDLDPCVCTPGASQCSAGVVTTCATDGSALGAPQPCFSGQCADATSCAAVTCNSVCEYLGAASLTTLECAAQYVPPTVDCEVDPGDLGGAPCQYCFEGADCDALAQACL